MAQASRAAFVGGGSLNFAETATLSDGAWQTNLPRSNLQHPDINTLARTTDAANASTRVKALFGSARPVGGIVIGPSNPTPGSTWRVRGYTDSFTTMAIDSGTITVPGTTADSLDYEWTDPELWFGRDTSLEIFPFVHSYIIPDADLATAATCLSWFIEFFDAANVDGYREFGWLSIGRCWRPSVNYSPGDNSFSFDKIGDVSESIGGQRNNWDRGLRRTWNANFGYLGQNEGFDEVGRMMRVLSNSRQFFVSPDPTDTGRLRDRSFITAFKTIPSLALSNVDLAATGFACEEVK